LRSGPFALTIGGMSKAFTREDAGVPEEPDDEEVDLPKAGAKRYITPEGYKKLGVELARLWKVERPRVTQEVSDAAAQGDRSENAEYIYGKKKLREIDRRIRYLTKLLDRLTVVEPNPAQEGCVFFGATVTVEDEDGKRSTYTIVGPDEIDLNAGRISTESPVAKALLGKRIGDDVTVRRPKGEVELSVIAIRYGS
jgi:transcription elongation factor GreB